LILQGVSPLGGVKHEWYWKTGHLFTSFKRQYLENGKELH